MPKTIKPSRVFPGHTVAVAAPSSYIDGKILEPGIEKLRKFFQVRVRFDARIVERERTFAGGDLERAKILHDFLAATDVSALWCARGGYGATRILPLLDRWKTAAKLRRAPKVLLGYSDITALHLYFFGKLGMPGIHAPLAATPKWLKVRPTTLSVIQQMLVGRLALGKKSYTAKWKTKFLPGSPRRPVSGTILGGNLTLIINMVGTPWMPQFPKRTILFLEDCAEPPYKIDRMLAHLRNAGVLKNVVAVLAGDLEADVPRELRKKDGNTWQAVLADHFVSHGVPVLAGLPVGHGKQNEPLPLGVRAKITTAGKLEILEQVVT